LTPIAQWADPHPFLVDGVAGDRARGFRPAADQAPGTVYMALASAEFEEADYIRDRAEFLRAARIAV
jgi:WxcM-like, C-terminal